MTSNKFTFHIPNLFPRETESTPTSLVNYEQLSGEDDGVDTVGETAVNGVGQAQGQQGDIHSPKLFGVDATLSWKRKSNSYKTATWLAFGTLGAAVLLPL